MRCLLCFCNKYRKGRNYQNSPLCSRMLLFCSRHFRKISVSVMSPLSSPPSSFLLVFSAGDLNSMWSEAAQVKLPSCSAGSDMKIWFLPQFIAWRSEVSLRYEFYYQWALDRTLDYVMFVFLVNNIHLSKLKSIKWASNYLKPNSEVYWIYWKTSGNFSLLTSPPWCFYGQ